MKKNIWKMVRLMIAAVAAAAACTAAASAADSTWVDAGNYSAPTLNPTTNEIMIDTPQELAWVSYSVMNGNTFEGYTILLEDDIDLAGHLWQPIGGWNGSAEDTTKYFAGTFDGQGYDILNMTVERPGLEYNGLFGLVGDARIRNVEVLDCIVSSLDENGDCERSIAGLIGDTYYGNQEILVMNCGVSGTIIGDYAGGLFGMDILSDTIVFNNCYSSCKVQDGRYDEYAFGSGGKYINCWYNADLCSRAIGSDKNKENCYAVTAQSLEETDYVELLNVKDYSGKKNWVTGEDGYPAFGTEINDWERYTKAVEPQDSVYYIGSAGELAYIAELVNDGDSLAGYTVKLMKDIDLSGKFWTPIGADYDAASRSENKCFEGDFDGNHKTICGLTISTLEGQWNEEVGLFGYMVGDVCDVTIESPVIYSEASGYHVGTLVGCLEGSAMNCHVTDCQIEAASTAGGLFGSIRYGILTDCSVTGEIISSGDAGGIAAEIGMDSVRHCSFSGTIYAEGVAGGTVGQSMEAPTLIQECFTAGTVKGGNHAGGILGSFDLIFESCVLGNCYSTCNLTAAKGSAGGILGHADRLYNGDSLVIKNCYAIGNVDGAKESGILIGGMESSTNLDVTITNCYWYKDAVLSQLGLEIETVGSAITPATTKGLTLDQMKKQSSFAGFDFDTVWAIDADKNGGFPYLRWQTAVPEVVAPTAIGLNTTALTMETGSARWLAVSFEPANASGTITWISADEDIARVTEGGQVIAVGAGETVITATCGRLTATCTVTVNMREEDSYVLNDLELQSASGQNLDAIPRDSFWVSVSVTKQEESDDAVVVLATYSADGKFLNLYAMKTNAAVGTEQVFSVLLDNRAGKIAEIRAFVWSSLASPIPLAASVGT